MMRKLPGFTLIELLIVIAIVGVLATVLFIVLSGQINKARDAQRKADLTNLKKALEDYLIQNECYPTSLPACGGDFSPYLKPKIPCDPVSSQPYYYEPQQGSCPKYFRLFGNLEYDTDPAITEGGCSLGSAYNWGVTSGDVNLGDTGCGGAGGGGGGTPTPSPTPGGGGGGGTPTPSPTPGGGGGAYYGCQSGVCIQLSGPVCQPNYADSNCNGQCGTPQSPLNECQ